jgi:hypothetical protein
MKATIRECGNGFPSKGDYVPGDDCSLYRVVETSSNIHTGRPYLGEGNWIEAVVEEADWDDALEEFPALVSVQEDSANTYQDDWDMFSDELSLDTSHA